MSLDFRKKLWYPSVANNGTTTFRRHQTQKGENYKKNYESTGLKEWKMVCHHQPLHIQG